MGKTTRFHPVSLPTIRGAAQNCGFRLGRINQRYTTPDLKTAVYFVPVVEVPSDIHNIALDHIRTALNQCFSSDIVVRIMWITHGGQIMAEIVTTIDARNARRDPAEWTEEPFEDQSLEWLIEDTAEDEEPL